jgi:arabinogalactan endo-1,4-beta-galactosidase
MIHIDDGYDKTLQKNWFGALTGAGVSTSEWDVFGFSFYPFYGTAATFSNLKSSLNFIARKYNKPIQVVETDWPNQCSGSDAPALSEPSIPISAEGQVQWVHEVVDIVKKLPNGLGMCASPRNLLEEANIAIGQGVNYWEPAWLYVYLD